MTDQEFDFHLRVVAVDSSGYYYARWDRATPIIVRAATKAAALTQAWAVMGECRRGWHWQAKTDRIEAAPAASPVSGGNPR